MYCLCELYEEVFKKFSMDYGSGRYKKLDKTKFSIFIKNNFYGWWSGDDETEITVTREQSRIFIISDIFLSCIVPHIYYN